MIVTFRSLLWLAVAAPLASSAADWPQWRGPTRDGVSTETCIGRDWAKEPPKELWKASIGAGFSSVAASGGLAFASGNQEETDTLYAFDAVTGELKWKHAYPCALGSLRHEGGPYATPTVEGGRVYQHGKLGQLFCLEADTGKVVWETSVAEATGTGAPNYGFSSSPLVAGNLLILNVGPAGAAVDKRTGKVVWHSAPDEPAEPVERPRARPETEAPPTVRPGHASPLPYCIGGHQGVAILAKARIVGVEPATGKVLWRQDLPSEGRAYKIADPVFVGDRFLITASYLDFCALFRVRDGQVEKLWQNESLLTKFLNPVLLDGHVVGGHREQTFRCVELATGTVKWEQSFAGNVLLVEGLGLILTTEGELVLADIGPDGYREITRARVLTGKCWTPPALAGHRLYCRNARGDLVCVELPGR